MGSESFWNAQDRARKVVSSVKGLKAQLDPLTSVIKDFEDAKLAYQMGKEMSDRDLLAEADDTLFKLQPRMEQVELRSLLSGKHDASNCFLSISAGQGGT